MDSFPPLYTYSRPTLHCYSLASLYIATQSFYLYPIAPYQSITYWYQLTAQRTAHPSLTSRAPKHPITMSSSRKDKKNVEFERTKSSKSRHRSSRDSGVGSSSASDRASLGTPEDGRFTYQQVNDQREILGAVQNALDAANEKIRQLEAVNAKLNNALSDSHKENRLLKREKGDLANKLEDARDVIENRERTIDKLAKRASPERSEKSSSTSTRSSHRDSGHHEEKRTIRESGRRSSWREAAVPMFEAESMRHSPPRAPHPKLNTTPNPFAPRGAPMPAATYIAPGPVAYASNSVSYAAGPTFGQPPSPSRGQYRDPNDGRYHLTPL